MLFSTSLLAVSGNGIQPHSSTRRLLIINTKRNSTICELNFVSSVLAIRLNRQRLICCLEESVQIYDVSNMKLVYSIDTSPNSLGILYSEIIQKSLNSKGVCDLSSAVGSSSQSYLAYPPTHQTGQILLFDTNTLQALHLIQAHKSPLAKLAFSQDGSMLASASVKGTVVRIFSVPDGKRLYQLRRGSSSAKIQSISFSQAVNGAVFVVVCSDSDTIHIYKLPSSLSSSGHTNQSATSPSSGLVSGALSVVGSLGSMANSALSGYLPEFVNDFWESSRDFAHLRLPLSTSSDSLSQSGSQPSPSSLTVPTPSSLSTGVSVAPPAPSPKTVSAISAAICGNQVLVVCRDGYVLKYGFDPNGVGGECPLLKSHYLLEDEPSVDSVQIHLDSKSSD